ncbi:hypothetical protein B0H14DRAFT_2362552, partial [Mycena olivaceomarginata]
QEHGGRVTVFNLERSDGDEYADFVFLGPCEETLPDALGSNQLQFYHNRRRSTGAGCGVQLGKERRG